LAAPTDTALAIYDAFHTQFNGLFLVEASLGERWVRKYLRTRLGFAAEPLVEAVLSAIRNKRLHLLEAFRRKYQNSLFGATTFQPQRLQGYFRRVAQVESLKAPVEELERVTGRPWECLNRLPAPTGFALDAEGESGADAPSADLASRASQVAAFWTDPANRFTRAQYLEGMATLGLGWLTDEPVLANRCREHLTARLPAWTAVQQQLGDQVGRLLDRRGQLEAEHLRLRNAGTLARVSKIQQRLDSLQMRLSQHQDRLRPRPHEVAELLDGLVSGHVGGIRFKRIAREIAILRRRVEKGAAGLPTAQTPGAAGLVADVLAHMKAKPPTVRGHDLTEEEKGSRLRAHEVWQEAGEELLVRVHWAVRGLYREPAHSSPELVGWLYDVQDLYAFGILDRTGIVGALKTRRGARLNWLLRPDRKVGPPDLFPGHCWRNASPHSPGPRSVGG
jgi:hypothetical protein